MDTRRAGGRVRGLLGAAAGLLMLAVLTAASTAAAADPAFTETEVEMVIPVEVEVLEHPCTLEPVVLEGHLFLREHLTFNETHMTFTASINTQGVTGVNPITGVKYVSSDVDTFTATIQKSTSTTGHQSWLFSRSGETAADDDFYLHYLIRFSWNANGTVTTEFENFRTDCRQGTAIYRGVRSTCKSDNSPTSM
jgi:hypothetical protein